MCPTSLVFNYTSFLHQGGGFGAGLLAGGVTSGGDRVRVRGTCENGHNSKVGGIGGGGSRLGGTGGGGSDECTSSASKDASSCICVIDGVVRVSSVASSCVCEYASGCGGGWGGVSPGGECGYDGLDCVIVVCVWVVVSVLWVELRKSSEAMSCDCAYVGGKCCVCEVAGVDGCCGSMLSSSVSKVDVAGDMCWGARAFPAWQGARACVGGRWGRCFTPCVIEFRWGWCVG